VLESCGLHGTFFVTTGFVSSTSLWFDRITLAWYRDAAAAVRSACSAVSKQDKNFGAVATFDEWWDVLKRLPAATLMRVVTAVEGGGDAESAEVFGAMTPLQLRVLAQRGHEIGSHAMTHQLLTNLDDVSLQAELAHSRALVREWTGHDAEGVCYPNGDYDDRVIGAARAAGYGCGVGRGMADVASDRMALPRRAILSSARHGSATELFEHGSGGLARCTASLAQANRVSKVRSLSRNSWLLSIADAWRARPRFYREII